MANHKKPQKGARQMMNNATIGKNARFTIDLTQVEGEGSFPCPQCGTMISPDEDNDEIYKIVDTKVINGDLLELLISCGSCQTLIKVTGFQQIIESLTSE